MSGDAERAMTKRGLLNLALEATKDRGLNYGRPADNFRRIARLWNAHILNRYGDGFGGDTTIAIPALDEIDVALMMDLMKTARLENAPAHLDSWIDKAGYTACGAEIALEKEKRSFNSPAQSEGDGPPSHFIGVLGE